jgi:ABC-2 type transport system ATP-binding protein
MQQAGVEDVAPVVIAHLSKGYRQRVGLADALVASPPLLILDEPTAGLDPNQIREVRRLIRELGKEHTVFLSTHILSEVESICDRAIVIDRGRIVAEGTLRDLQARRGAVEMELLVVDRGGRSAKLVENSPGVETIEVEALGENRLRLRVRSTDKTSPDALMESLVRILVENQVGVRGATCLKARLEDVFSELTRAETTEAGPGGAQDWSKPAG